MSAIRCHGTPRSKVPWCHTLGVAPWHQPGDRARIPGDTDDLLRPSAATEKLR
jgi:hypothetical protein